MGIHSMVKGAFSSIKNKNTTNTRLTLKWKRRVISIAEDIERSQDPTKEERLENILATVVDEFATDSSIDDVVSRFNPQTFERRKEALLEADKLLDEIKPPESGRRNLMEEAAAKDYEAMKEDIEALCEETVLNLQRLCNILPTRQRMRDQVPEWDKANTSKSQSLLELQAMMAKLHDRLASMQENGLLDSNLLVMVFHLEEPDEKEPIPLVIPLDYTFCDLAEDLLKSDPALLLPDFWVKRKDETYNQITASNISWEYQPPFNRVCEVPVVDERNDSRAVDIVVGKDNYVVALVNKNGIEMGKVVELPRATRCASSHMASIFADYKISRILDLREGTDVGAKAFNKNYFKANTNSLYIELEPI
ncbi:hypothetical protein M408DRAFT_327305 [Serendipita vermifera MAFF 305830]|uniref:Uncharacterized protein n=1 Tax=Serendipita vermifera MAFF 305830 TaxID=933852 RepID=A0A0C3BK91_SERVB|nr:hypothetical protein M408DRAFT_327305 [Serendipita vermifera MAFF 305830]